MPAFDDLRLETARLTLRPAMLEDLDSWTEMMLDEPTTRFIGGTAPRSMCWRQLMTMIGAWHSMGFAMSPKSSARATSDRAACPLHLPTIESISGVRPWTSGAHG